MPVTFECLSPIISAAAITWDTVKSDAGITFSGANLTAFAASPPANSVGQSTGSGISSSAKKYFEFTTTTVGAGNAFGVGLIDSAFSYNTANFLGQTAHDLSYYGSGSIFTGGGSPATLASYASGNNVSCAVDGSVGKVWFRVNGGSWNNTTDDPATNTGGLSLSAMTLPVWPALVFRSGQAGQLTALFASSGWAYSAPSGFTQL